METKYVMIGCVIFAFVLFLSSFIIAFQYTRNIGENYCATDTYNGIKEEKCFKTIEERNEHLELLKIKNSLRKSGYANGTEFFSSLLFNSSSGPSS